MFRHQSIIKGSFERGMSGNLLVPIQTQLETSLSPNIIMRIEESTGERKSKHLFQNR
jgi:hypothetical protein